MYSKSMALVATVTHATLLPQMLRGVVKMLYLFACVFVIPLIVILCPFSITILGDTGEGDEPTEGELIRESDNTFTIWASGRQNCIGMVVQLDVSVIFMLSFCLQLK